MHNLTGDSNSNMSEDESPNSKLRIWYVLLVIGMFLFIIGLRMIGV